MSNDNINIKTEIVDYEFNKAENSDVSYLARKIREKEALSKEDVDVIFSFFTQLIYFIKMCYLYYKLMFLLI